MIVISIDTRVTLYRFTFFVFVECLHIKCADLCCQQSVPRHIRIGPAVRLLQKSASALHCTFTVSPTVNTCSAVNVTPSEAAVLERLHHAGERVANGLRGRE